MKTLGSTLPFAAIACLTLSFSGLRPCYTAEIGKGVDFYLLEDEKMNFTKARDLPLNELKLQAAPWIASDNIERYDWSCHYVYLKQPVVLPGDTDKQDIRGKPFVVVAHGLRCYLGAIWSMPPSPKPKGDVAMVCLEGDKIERFMIKLGGIAQEGQPLKDIRDNAVVKETLKREGLLHEGLECKLDKVDLERKDGDSSMVYTYTISNKDQDDLYVLDPEKFKPAAHHINNQLVLKNVENGNYTYRLHPLTGYLEPVAKIELSWYTRLKKGESLTRSIKVKPPQYSPPEPGKYTFFFINLVNFETMGNNQLLLKDNKVSPDPKAADGRIWLGELTAELNQKVK
jgi:hypothetical protein